jgi:hypothetical protein
MLVLSLARLLEKTDKQIFYAEFEATGYFALMNKDGSTIFLCRIPALPEKQEAGRNPAVMAYF